MITSSLVRISILLLVLASSCAQTARFRQRQEDTPPQVPAGPADVLSVASEHLKEGREAVASQQWDTAETELDRAMVLLWRSDFQSIPRERTADRRALRSEVEQLLSQVLAHSAPSVTFSAQEDSLFDDEKGVASAFDQLLKITSSARIDPSIDAKSPDPTRFDMPVNINSHVAAAINLLRTDGSYRFTAWLNRSNLYGPLIRSVFQREGIPGDLVYTAMMGSGYQPRAFSSEKAAGLWQIPLAAATDYGLRRTSWIDERLDPKKATWAMARRFQTLYGILGNWNLAIAAHHAGLATVEAARKPGATLWELDLPDRTIQFVAFVHAAAIISKDPELYGMQPHRTLPITYETVGVDDNLHLDAIAGGMNLPNDALRLLNPELRRWRIPSGGYPLKVPVGNRLSYMTWAGIEDPEPDPGDIIVYTVRRGDNILKIARRFQVFADDIIAENEIRRPDRLKIGQALFIPSYGQRRTTTPSRPQTRAATTSRKPLRDYPTPDIGTHTRVTYRVRRGDNLEGIGTRYNVPIGAIQSWNKINDPRDLMAGQSLSIWIPSEASAKPTRGAVPAGKKAVDYTVRRGDTLWDIARQFNVTVSSIQSANNLTRRSRIYPGNKLTILIPQ